jgi:BMFP domain-containing protein YqiC
MQTDNRFFDDIARLFAGAAGNVASLRQEFETRMREQAERLLRGMDLVSREEFAAVEAMAAKARAEQVALERRIASLEARLAVAGTPGAADAGAPAEPPAA